MVPVVCDFLCIVILPSYKGFLASFFLEEAQAAQPNLASPEELVSQPEDSKEVKQNCADDRTEDAVLNKEIPSPHEGQTSLADIAIEKAQQSEE